MARLLRAHQAAKGGRTEIKIATAFWPKYDPRSDLRAPNFPGRACSQISLSYTCTHHHCCTSLKWLPLALCYFVLQGPVLLCKSWDLRHLSAQCSTAQAERTTFLSVHKTVAAWLGLGLPQPLPRVAHWSQWMGASMWLE